MLLTLRLFVSFTLDFFKVFKKELEDKERKKTLYLFKKQNKINLQEY